MDVKSNKFGESERALRRRIRALRNSLGLNQRDFASRPELNVTQAQVSEWERGTETPSVQKIIAMANMAKLHSERLYFWRFADVNIEQLRKDLADESALALLKPDDASSFAAPLVKRFLIGRSGGLQFETEGSLRLPSVMFNTASSTFCMQVPQDWYKFPQAYKSGDYVAIEQAVGDLDDLEGCDAAVLMDKTPEGYERTLDSAHFRWLMQSVQELSKEELDRDRLEGEAYRRLHPDAAAESDRHNNEVSARIEARLQESIIVFGRINVEIAGGEQERQRESKKLASRIVLEFRNVGKLALSDWQIGRNLIRPRIADSVFPYVHIIGRVVGHFEDRNKSLRDTAGG